jgi:hypothetical protein
MSDDEMMNDLLRAAMSTRTPQLSANFAQDVRRRTAPRRLTPAGRIVVGVYAVATVVFCVWMMRDLPLGVTAVTLVTQAVAAVALRSYTSHLTRVAHH